MNGLTMSPSWTFTNFYSELKEKNVLEIRDKDEDLVADIGKAHYQELQNIWLQRGMSTFKDFLIYYNNLDIWPFVQAVEKM